MFISLFFVFNDTSTTEIYTYLHPLSLHDALPICHYLHLVSRAQRLAGLQAVEDAEAFDRIVGERQVRREGFDRVAGTHGADADAVRPEDRKSTRLNSSH